jgi:trehalose 6-phosphate phosphatase
MAERGDAIAAVVSCLKGARRIVFLLDYDGTLAVGPPLPSASRFPSPGVSIALEALSSSCALLAIVTGRSERNLIAVLPSAEGYVVATSHGLSIRAGRGAPAEVASALSLTVGEEELPAVHAAHAFAERELIARGFASQGVRINDEAHFFSFQVAALPPDVVAGVQSLAEEAAAFPASAAPPHSSPTPLSVHALKGVIEVRPPSAVTWDKGSAVTHMLGALRLAGAADVAVVAVGDDVSDEAMFRAARDAGCGRCMTVIVGEPKWPTAATHTVPDPAGVEALLAAAAAMLASPQGAAATPAGAASSAVH